MRIWTISEVVGAEYFAVVFLFGRGSELLERRGAGVSGGSHHLALEPRREGPLVSVRGERSVRDEASPGRTWPFETQIL